MKKTLKHSLACLIALAMLVVMAIPAFAQTVGNAADGPATITIKNAAKGETYKVVKLFDATYNSGADAISYSGTIPTELADFFEAKDNGIVIKQAEGEDVSIDGPAAAAKFKAWAEKQSDPTAQAVADGTTLKFQGLPYGYYVVTTTQGAMVGVDSLRNSAEVYDKNNAYPWNLSKTADKTDVNIGDTITYTVTFDTSNFNGSGESAKRIKSYTITDTLPDFLKETTVTSIVVNDNGTNKALATTNFVDGKITIDWAENSGTEQDPDYKSIYNNNATITITYTAKLTDKATIDVPGNTNKVSLTWTTVDGVDHDTIPEDPNGPEDPNEGKKVEDTETVFTYAIALQKVNDEGTKLAGATFELPFYVNENLAADGAYVYAGTETGTGLTNTVTTPANGLIIVKGVKSGTYSITETQAPDGYNKLTTAFDVTAAKVSEEKTNVTTYLDANGDVTEEETETVVTTTNDIAATVKVVVNKKGAFLPSTGGIGTYIVVIAGLAIVAAGVILMTKRNKKEEE